MKIKDDFVVREIADEFIVVPTGDMALKLNGLITINETGNFIWQQLQEDKDEDSVIGRIMEEYEVDRETAEADFREFINVLEKYEILE